MNLWQRLFGRKQDPVFVPVYPVLRSGVERVACPPTFSPEFKASFPEQKPVRKHINRTKPWNKPKACRNIAAGVLSDMRAAGFDGACTCPEMDEWITNHCEQNNLDIGGLSYTSIRAAIKKCSGIRFENRRLKDNPAYEFLRNRHRARKQFVPERCWIFIVEQEPDHVEASLQLNRRAA